MQKREWAHVVDVRKPMTNFRELVPEMAHKVCEFLATYWNYETLKSVNFSIRLNWILSRKRLYIILKLATLYS